MLDIDIWSMRAGTPPWEPHYSDGSHSLPYPAHFHEKYRNTTETLLSHEALGNDQVMTISLSRDALHMHRWFRWCREGRAWFLHRENGPAYLQINSNGEVVYEEWLQAGELHRWDGPALPSRNTWWLLGNVVPIEQVEELMRQYNISSHEEIVRFDSGTRAAWLMDLWLLKR